MIDMEDEAGEWAETATEMEYFAQEEINGLSLTDEDTPFDEIIEAAEEAGNLYHFKCQITIGSSEVEFSFVQCGEGDVIGYLITIDGELTSRELISWTQEKIDSESIAEVA